MLVIGQGGRAHSLKARVVSKREFAGYWEYVLDEAIFTAPAHPQWGGAALVGEDGRLLGIGSLLVQEAAGDKTVDGNMFVPIDLLEPILADLLASGRPARPPRPWLGPYAAEMEGRVVVGGLAPGGPAERAGAQLGDLILQVAGERPAGLAHSGAGGRLPGTCLPNRPWRDDCAVGCCRHPSRGVQEINHLLGGWCSSGPRPD